MAHLNSPINYFQTRHVFSCVIFSYPGWNFSHMPWSSWKKTPSSHGLSVFSCIPPYSHKMKHDENGKNPHPCWRKNLYHPWLLFSPPSIFTECQYSSYWKGLLKFNAVNSNFQWGKKLLSCKIHFNNLSLPFNNTPSKNCKIYFGSAVSATYSLVDYVCVHSTGRNDKTGAQHSKNICSLYQIQQGWLLRMKYWTHHTLMKWSQPTGTVSRQSIDYIMYVTGEYSNNMTITIYVGLHCFWRNIKIKIPKIKQSWFDPDIQACDSIVKWRTIVSSALKFHEPESFPTQSTSNIFTCDLPYDPNTAH